MADSADMPESAHDRHEAERGFGSGLANGQDPFKHRKRGEGRHSFKV
jgi:hypothetical protein